MFLALLAGVGLITLGGQLLPAAGYYLTWHTVLETMAITVALLVFAVGWNANSLHPQRNILILSCAFLGVAILDCSHMLSLVGQPGAAAPGSVETASLLRLVARYLGAIVLLLVAWLPAGGGSQRGRCVPLLAVSAVVAAAHWASLWLPATFVQGQGLTTFMLKADYGLVVLHLLTVGLLARRLGQTASGANVPLLIGAVLTLILSELCFTQYAAVADAYNLMGHVYKVLAFVLLYRAVMLSRDVTALGRDEATLHKLSQAVEQSPNTIIITDLAARIEYANQAFTQVSGYSLDEILGCNPSLLSSGKTPKAIYDDMWRQLTSGQSWSGELVNRRKDGSEYIESVRISPLFDAAGQPTNYLAIKEDITQRKLDEQCIERLAHFDALTELPNRKLFAACCEQALGLCERSQQPLAVLYLDLDHFKHINDSLGYRIGDAFLVQVAQRLKSVLRDEDTLSRQGADEFVLVLPCTDAKGAAQVAEQFKAQLAAPCRVEEHSLVITTSIGIAVFPEDGRDFESLAQRADIAMHRAKQEGGNGYRFFTAEMQRQSARILQLENALRQALDNGELHLCFQPQLSIDGERLVGAEALLRWTHPRLGVISPAEFIPIAESSGLILPIGEWVLRRAVWQMSDWLAQGYPPQMTVSVNLSLAQLRHPGLVELVAEALEESGLPAHCLELELTESVAMHDPAAAIAVVRRLHALGVLLSIDDFGTGYSSLSYLTQFQVHKLKIDRSFIQQISEDGHDQSIVRAIIGMAHGLGMLSIAEGVETAGQCAELKLLGCEEVQGYLFGKPMPAAELAAWASRFLAPGSRAPAITHEWSGAT